MFDILKKYNMAKLFCEHNLNIFQQIFNVIKYFKSNSKNVEHIYFRYNYNKHSMKILSKTNCKLKRYRIISQEIPNNENITFKVYLKLYDLFTSLLLTSNFINNAITRKVNPWYININIEF